MDGVTQAHGKLLKDTSIQFHFPAAPAPEPPEPPSVPWNLGDGSAVFWIVVAMAVAGILFVAVNQIRAYRARVATGAPGPANTPLPPGPAPVVVPRAALDEADVLAAAGRYGEAVHALLLRGVGAIRQRYPRALAPSHTSRDIARLPVLPENTRHAFAGIAQRTERAVFARTDLVQEDWEACRALYAGLLPAAPSRTAPS